MKCLTSRVFLAVELLLLFATSAQAAKPYKIYVVNKYGAWDIVCDRYTVKKDDHVWEILRRKGRLSEEDFPKFVKILKDMNPNIKDVDKIYPGQNIVIPLKEMPARGTGVKEGPRYVTIPMIPDVLFDYYNVKPGDYVSKIVTARLGVSWNEIPSDYFKTFKRLNPDVKDMDLIYPGQALRVPELVAYKKPAVQPGSTIPKEDSSAKTNVEDRGKAKVEPAEIPRPGKKIAVLDKKEEATATTIKSPQYIEKLPISRPSWQGFISKVAAKLGGRMLSSGYCYFPGKDNEDVPLDLAAFPVVELKGGGHVLFETEIALPRGLEEAMRSSWKEMVVIRANRDAEKSLVLDKVFRGLFGSDVKKNILIPSLDDGVQVTLRGDWVFSQQENKDDKPTYYSVTVIKTREEYTPVSAVKYLTKKGIRIIDILMKEDSKDQRGPAKDEDLKTAVTFIDGSGQEAFIFGLMSAMGYYYEPQVPISFDYAGFQVETTANIVYAKGGTDVVVDFGTFYGDARSAIEKGGLKVFSIKPDDKLFVVAKNLLKVLACSYDESPALFAANRELSKTTSLTLPGVLISPAGGKRGLLTEISLDPKIMAFLKEKEIDVWEIRSRLPGTGG